jgi:hypothetical protein
LFQAKNFLPAVGRCEPASAVGNPKPEQQEGFDGTPRGDMMATMQTQSFTMVGGCRPIGKRKVDSSSE